MHSLRLLPLLLFVGRGLLRSCEVWEVLASATSNSHLDFNVVEVAPWLSSSNSHLVVNCSGQDEGLLHIHLPGTKTENFRSLEMLKFVSGRISRTVVINYNSLRRPQGSSEWKGRADAVLERIFSLIAWLGWTDFIRDNTINWSKVYLSGHSQGGGIAALLASRHKIASVVISSSVWDGGPWIGPEVATDGNRIFGIANRLEEVQCPYWKQLETFNRLKIPEKNRFVLKKTPRNRLHCMFWIWVRSMSGLAATQNVPIVDSAYHNTFMLDDCLTEGVDLIWNQVFFGEESSLEAAEYESSVRHNTYLAATLFGASRIFGNSLEIGTLFGGADLAVILTCSSLLVICRHFWKSRAKEKQQ